MAELFRPMHTGEVLRQTVRLYRNHFGLFVGISAVPNLLELALRLAAHVWGGRPNGAAAPGWLAALARGSTSASALGSAVVAIAQVAVLALVTGVTVWAVRDLWRGDTAGISASLRRIKGKIATVTFTNLWAAFFALIPMAVGATLALLLTPLMAGWGRLSFAALALILALAGIAAGIRLSLEFALAVPALLLEDLGIFAALRRSMKLTEGYVGRVFVVTLLPAAFALLLWGLSAGLAAAASGLRLFPIGTWEVWRAARRYLLDVLAMPVGTIGVSLLYFDLSGRKGAVDAGGASRREGERARE